MKTKDVTKKFALMILPIIALSMLLPEGANAQGSGSHGGDARCGVFYDIASDIALTLVKMGQAKVTAVNPLIEVKPLWDKVSHIYDVLPAHHLDRQALTDPDTRLTKLDVEQWDQISSYYEKLRLVSHELMVLMNLEGEGQYSVSKDLLQLVMTTKVALPVKSARYVQNVDGSYTIFNPQYFDGETTYPIGIEYNNTDQPQDLNGICLYLGLAEVGMSRYVTQRFVGLLASLSNSGSLNTLMPPKGFGKGLKGLHGPERVEIINCK